MSQESRPSQTPKENVLVNLVCNVFLPGLLLDKLSKASMLGPVWGLVAALSIPLGYGIWDFARRRVWNVFSILGLVSVAMTGVLGLLKTDPFWFAVKEAAIPSLLAVAIPLSLRTKQPLIRTLLFNEQILDTALIDRSLDERKTHPEFERLMVSSSWILAASFLGSAVLNFILARWMLTAAPGTDEFNKQLGRMNWLSWPVIFVPSMGVMVYALLRLVKGLERITGLKGEDLFANKPKAASAG